jgi:hypothetical protein
MDENFIVFKYGRQPYNFQKLRTTCKLSKIKDDLDVLKNERQP